MSKTIIEIGNGGFMKIDDGAFIAIDGVELKLCGLENSTKPRHYLDGEPVVVLTLEEAKLLYTIANVEFVRLLTERGASVDLIKKVEEAAVSLRDKIEQSEGK